MWRSIPKKSNNRHYFSALLCTLSLVSIATRDGGATGSDPCAGSKFERHWTTWPGEGKGGGERWGRAERASRVDRLTRGGYERGSGRRGRVARHRPRLGSVGWSWPARGRAVLVNVKYRNRFCRCSGVATKTLDDTKLQVSNGIVCHVVNSYQCLLDYCPLITFLMIHK